jgi:hypothetical protein
VRVDGGLDCLHWCPLQFGLLLNVTYDLDFTPLLVKGGKPALRRAYHPFTKAL